MIQNEFEFKTKQPYFDKEKHGIKNNTVREIDLNDDRFKALLYWNQAGWNDGDIIVKIKEPFTGEVFVRDIRDISVYNNIMIITWNHKKSVFDDKRTKEKR